MLSKASICFIMKHHKKNNTQRSVIHNIICWHYENTPIQRYRKFYIKKLENLQIKTDVFHISAQNVDCGYSLEPPW